MKTVDISQEIPGGTVHPLPADVRQALTAHPDALALWLDITPLARNEWICWAEAAKHLDTRERRVARICSELVEGMRRPCCWIGCIHRTDKAISPSVQGILDKRKTKA